MTQICQAAVPLAIASHLVFTTIEPTPAVIVSLYALGSSSFLYYLPSQSILTSTTSLFVALTVYTTALFTSIAIYRLFLHRIRHIPGPRLLALSKWSSIPMDLAGKRPQHINALHKQYGDLIRIGPREVSINNVAAIQPVLGAKLSCLRGPWYTTVSGLGRGGTSLACTIDLKNHRARKRIWEQGFTMAALKEYHEELIDTKENLMNQLAKRAENGQTVNIDQWVQMFAFDFMYYLGFSKRSGFLAAGSLSNALKILEECMEMVMVVGNVPYIAPLSRLLPNAIKEFEDYQDDALRERMKRGATAPDLFSHLLGEDEKSGYKHTFYELAEDAGLVVLAGSDTTTSALAMAFYSIVKHPQYVDQLREEIDAVFGEAQPDNFDSLAKECPLLNAFLDETLRLYPPVPSGLQRVTPPEGLSIQTDHGPLVIPGNINISIPIATIQTDPRYFSPQPLAFRPERWLKPDAEERFDRNAILFFGHGPTGCVGKSLAWMEMRMILASIVQRFDLSFVPDFDEDAFFKGIKDVFAVQRKHPLQVVIKNRSK